MKAIYKQRCGYRIGSGAFSALNVTWPFGLFEISPEGLVLNRFGRPDVFPKEAVTRLSVYKGLWSKGLRIEHSIPDYEKLVVVWSLELEDLLEQLREAGYHIETAS